MGNPFQITKVQDYADDVDLFETMRAPDGRLYGDLSDTEIKAVCERYEIPGVTTESTRADMLRSIAIRLDAAVEAAKARLTDEIATRAINDFYAGRPTCQIIPFHSPDKGAV